MEARPALTNRQLDATNQFIEFWSEMASRWGINRTMAQIHALMYVTEQPLDTDQIMERLDISRGNANMNLHSLLRWKLVFKVEVDGSRKDHFVAEKDVWMIMAQIIKNREEQEIAPIVEKLGSFEDMFSPDSSLTSDEQVFVNRMQNMSQLMSVFRQVTQSLIPFVHSDNLNIIRQLISFADSMNAMRVKDTSTDDK